MRNTFIFLLLLVCTVTSCSKGSVDERFQSKLTSAKKYVEEEKFAEARIELQSAVDLKPEDPEGYYQLAEVQIRLGDYGRALENYNSAINFNANHTEARIHLASLQLIAKQYEQAEANLNHVLSLQPTNSDAIILKANFLAKGPQKNTEEARKLLNSVVEREPNNVAAIGSLGHLELVAENAQVAEEYFVRGLKLEPNNQGLQMALADLYARQGRLDEAQESLTKLVNANPSQTSLKYVLGEFFLKRGLNDNALEQYEQIVKQDAKNHDVRDKLYDMYLARKEFDKAKALTSELETKLPSDPVLIYFKGRNSELDDNMNQALEFYQKAILASNSFAPAFRKVGAMEIEMGKTAEGVEHLTQALAIDPSDIGSRLALAKTMLLKNDIGTAKNHVEEVLKRYPRQLGANIIRADIALIEGESTKARKVYQFLVENYPNIPSGYFKLGLLEEKEGHLDEAIRQFEKTLEFDTDILGPGRRIVLCMHEQKKSTNDMISKLTVFREKSKNNKGEFDVLIGSILVADNSIPNRLDLARQRFQSALEVNPNLIGAYFALGGIDAMSGDLKSAIVNYEKLIEKTPDHLPTRMLLALTFEREEQFVKAAEQYKKILEISPRFAPAANNLAYIILEQTKNGDLNEALRLAELAKEELPRESSVTDTLAWVHYRKGNARAALPLLMEAIRVNKEAEGNQPVNPEILYHLALVQNDLDNKDEARKTIQIAIERAGDKHPLYVKMKKLSDSIK